MLSVLASFFTLRSLKNNRPDGDDVAFYIDSKDKAKGTGEEEEVPVLVPVRVNNNAGKSNTAEDDNGDRNIANTLLVLLQ
jgi:hypothetical protein